MLPPTARGREEGARRSYMRYPSPDSTLEPRPKVSFSNSRGELIRVCAEEGGTFPQPPSPTPFLAVGVGRRGRSGRKRQFGVGGGGFVSSKRNQGSPSDSHLAVSNSLTSPAEGIRSGNCPGGSGFTKPSPGAQRLAGTFRCVPGGEERWWWGRPCWGQGRSSCPRGCFDHLGGGEGGKKPTPPPSQTFSVPSRRCTALPPTEPPGSCTCPTVITPSALCGINNSVC